VCVVEDNDNVLHRQSMSGEVSIIPRNDELRDIPRLKSLEVDPCAWVLSVSYKIESCTNRVAGTVFALSQPESELKLLALCGESVDLPLLREAYHGATGAVFGLRPKTKRVEAAGFTGERAL